MRFAVSVLIFVLISFSAFFGYYFFFNKDNGTYDENEFAVESRKLDKYTIKNLGRVSYEPGEIELGNVLKDEVGYESRVFYFKVDGKRVSGQINYPKAGGTYPVIVMSRGYIDRESYTTGDGTRRSSEEFAKAGFITLAPDFLGYGESDMPSELPIEERFQTYTTLLTILSSVQNLSSAFAQNEISVNADSDRIGLWGHSNGGQITLTVLEATGRDYPTVLWAPVSKPFPYSILYYTDDFEDHGKALRKIVANFEEDYDSRLYSIPNYLDRIVGSLSIHQGAADSEVPIEWSGDLVLELKKLNKKVEYFTYPEDDHNFANGNWDLVVSRNIEFYRGKL